MLGGSRRAKVVLPPAKAGCLPDDASAVLHTRHDPKKTRFPTQCTRLLSLFNALAIRSGILEVSDNNTICHHG